MKDDNNHNNYAFDGFFKQPVLQSPMHAPHPQHHYPLLSHHTPRVLHTPNAMRDVRDVIKTYDASFLYHSHLAWSPNTPHLITTILTHIHIRHLGRGMRIWV